MEKKICNFLSIWGQIRKPWKWHLWTSEQIGTTNIYMLAYLELFKFRSFRLPIAWVWMISVRKCFICILCYHLIRKIPVVNFTLVSSLNLLFSNICCRGTLLCSLYVHMNNTRVSVLTEKVRNFYSNISKYDPNNRNFYMKADLLFRNLEIKVS